MPRRSSLRLLAQSLRLPTVAVRGIDNPADLIDPAEEGQIEPESSSGWRSHGSLEALSAGAALLVVVAVTLYRFSGIERARYPGHADPAFYFNVAQNVRDGRGPTINYAWEFLSGQHALPQYAFGYWPPLPSAFMTLGLEFDNTLRGALAVNLIMSVILVIGVYLFARGLTGCPWVPAAAAVVVIVQPVVSRFAVESEGAIYLAAFAIWALAAAVRARARPWLWPVAGVLSGLASLSRTEGLVLFLALLIAAAAAPTGWRRRAGYAGSVFAGYVVTMSPVYVESMRHFGTLLPPASASFPFITNYEDLFALHVNHSLSALLGGGWAQFFDLRATTLAKQIAHAFPTAYTVDALILIVLLGAALPKVDRGPGRHSAGALQAVTRTARSPWFTPAAFAVATFLSYSLVAPVVSGTGAMSKGMVTILPIIIVGALVQLSRLALRPVVVATLVVVLAAAPLLTLAGATRSTVTANNAFGHRAVALEPALRSEQACLGRRAVLMTRSPWELTQATGIRSVEIPNGTLAQILRTARWYGVTDIEDTDRRDALRDITALTSRGGPLSVPAAVRGLKIYRIKAAAPAATC